MAYGSLLADLSQATITPTGGSLTSMPDIAAAALDAQSMASDAIPSAAPVITAPLSNPSTITESYEIPANSNALSVGPISVAAGTTVTNPIGSLWRVL